MNRLIQSVVALACALGAASTAHAQLTTITASHLNMGGIAIPSGMVTATPVDANGNAIAFAQGGGGLNGPIAFSCSINAGAIIGTCAWPDAALTTPPNICYSITVSRTTSPSRSFTLSKVCGITGTFWALDTYGPPAQTTNIQPVQMSYGTAAAPSPCLTPSIYIRNSAGGQLYICVNGAPVLVTGSGGAGTITAVTGVGPIVSSGGVTPAISCPTCSTLSNPVEGASAEYPMQDLSGTVVHDVSGNGNDATFVNGPPVWYAYGLAFNDTGFAANAVASLSTPLTTFGAFYVAHCTANMGATSGIADNLGPVTQFQPFTSTSSSSTGVMIYGGGNVYNKVVGVFPAIVTQPGFNIRTDLSWGYGGCHVYGYSLTAPSDGLDHITVDGVEPPSYSDHGASGANAPITGGTYQIGEDPFGNGMRGVLTYAIYYPTSHTVAQMQAVTRYIQAKLALRPTFPQYPVLNNTATPQLVFNGDSLIATYGGSRQLTADVTTNNTYNVTNYGIAGLTAFDTCKLYSQRWAQQTIPNQSTAVFWAGTNDFGAFGLRATTAEAWLALSQCASIAHQFGVRAVVASMISGNGRDANKNALNALIRAQWKQVGFDGFVDLAEAPGLGADGAFSNTACFNGDQVHLTGPGTGTCETVTTTALSGYGVVAALMSNGINSLDGSSATNPDKTTSTAFVSAASNNFVIQTPASPATYSLVDCQGETTPRTLVNGSASNAITVSAINSQTLTGSSTVAANATAVFSPILISPTASGCSWVRTQ